MLRIITTVGLSLFSNLDNKYDECIRGILSSLKKEVGDAWEIYGGSYAEGTDFDIPSIRAFFAKIGFQLHFSNAECSAETATLERIIKEIGCGADYEVYLLCTDTVLSRLAAELLAAYSPLMQGKTKVLSGDDEVGEVFEGKMIKGLSIYNAKRFKTEGLKNLVVEIRRIWKTQFDGESGKHRIVLNASGGYKGVLPFLTLISQLYEFPIYYKYQDDEDNITQELIKIDPIPFGFDWGMIYEVAPYLDQNWIDSAVKKQCDTSSFEWCVLSELRRAGGCGLELVSKGNNKITDIGLMLRAFYEGVDIDDFAEVDRNTPDGGYRSKVNSALMELIFNGWRMHFPYNSGGKIYSYVTHSSDNEVLVINEDIHFRNQIDIAMLTDDRSSFILGEVKYAYKISRELVRQHQVLEHQCATDEIIDRRVDTFKDIREQFDARLKECNGRYPDELHIYGFTAVPLNDDQKRTLQNSIDEIHNSLFMEYKIPVKAFYVDVGSNPVTIAKKSHAFINESIKQIYPIESNLLQQCIK
ncbi:MAG: hypothetical protein K9G39_04270 [Chlorobium sp.]|uniref:hypothetical protein n=1 Tax=Chlorobium sp. TaxID=1095 RepID=UPI0025B890A6|nr:hypothetical protein [Chlorobium sp.]MCF8382798.1 hypothetical protein [Chlorobium sp.]